MAFRCLVAAGRSFARAAASQDPDGALAWIELIGDANIRRGAFIDAATAWGRASPNSPHDTSTWPPRLAKAWAALSATARR